MSSHNVVYTSFDRFPAPKGAATHISAFVKVLVEEQGELDLVTASPERNHFPTTSMRRLGADRFQIRHTELPTLGQSLTERVLGFRTQLRYWWGARKPKFAHIRSIFEGYPIAKEKKAWCEKLVYEVNGLPSIELKYRYPRVADDPELMWKMLQQERICLKAADLVITVSEVNAEYLIRQGGDPARIHVIPNGVETVLFQYQAPRLDKLPSMVILYSGTFSKWQGLGVAIESLSLLRAEVDAKLIIAGSGKERDQLDLMRYAHRLGVAGSVEFRGGIPQDQLADLHHEADVVLVPLISNDRNLVQGCCPLKLLEAMASGTPVIASDLPVVRCIATGGREAMLVRPGSAKAIKEGLVYLRDNPCFARQLSLNARSRVENHFTWTLAGQKLRQAYRTIS